MSLRAALALTGAAALLSGCVAAAIPIAAGGMIAKQQTSKNEATNKPRLRQPTPPTAIARPELPAAKTPSKAPPERKTPQARAAVEGLAASTPKLMPTGLAALPPPSGALVPGTRPGQYQPLLVYLNQQATARASNTSLNSVVMAPGSRLDAPIFEPCGQKPLAVIFNLDEAEVAGGDPDARWRRWKGDGSDSVVAAPGVVDAIAAARRDGVTIIYSSGRSSAGASGIVTLLDTLGLGPAELGRTLFLDGNDKNPGSDDSVRQAISARYCVIALAGDESSDFSNLLGTGGGRTSSPRAATSGTRLASFWDAGWFMLPNPIRSTNIAAPGQ